jgi:4-amino-4-deoxy-L-arabinose transferase-like glycosyltransferase
MGCVVVSLIVAELPYMIAAMLAAPIALVVTAIILGKAERPARSAGLFVLGALALDVLFVLLIFWIYDTAGVDSGSGDVSAWIDVVLGAIFGFLGVKAVFSHPEPEERAAQRARIEKVATAKAGGLILGGILVQVINADAITMLAGGLKEIVTEDPLPELGSIIVVVAIFLFVMLIPYHLPLDMYLVSPEKGGRMSRLMSEKLLDHARMLEIVVGLAFGVIFLWKGLTAL